MADADQDQKTQEPTDKRLEDARKRGDVMVAAEMRHAVMFAGVILILPTLGARALTRLGRIFVALWGRADDFRIDPAGGQDFVAGLLGQILLAVGPLLAAFVGFALLTAFAQGRPTLAWSRLAPQWSKLSPWSGLARLFGPRAMIEFAKTLAKFAMVVSIVILVIRPRAAGLDQLVGVAPDAMVRDAVALLLMMLKAVALLAGALALFDFVYQRRAFLRRMRMTLQEVKDEHKDSEGDPKIKARIRAIQVQRARRRMMAAVPSASVVITNPTHYAVALKYKHGEMRAPIVIAKGVDGVALKIREVAGAARVPIVENRPLARALYASAEIDRPIPIEHYAAVAEIISYVMRLAKQRGAAAA